MSKKKQSKTKTNKNMFLNKHLDSMMMIKKMILLTIMVNSLVTYGFNLILNITKIMNSISLVQV